MSDTPGLLTLTAIGLAFVAAVGFGVAAFVQHRVVAANARDNGSTGLGVDALRSLAHQRRWVVGWVLFGAASLVHLSALILAPLSVVQPVGVLAVPVAVLLESHSARRIPSGRVLLGVALSMGGTAAFVLLVTITGRSTTATSPPTWWGVVTALSVVGATVVVLLVAARRGSPFIRQLAYAATGAICFGFSSALLRVGTRAFGVGGLSTVVTLTGFAVVCAFAVGAWAVQQAYASGSAAAVVGSLTVGDPLVGILLSAGLLGEGVSHGVAAVFLMVGCGAVAATGVLLLARHYPRAAPGSDRETTRAHPEFLSHPDDHPQFLVIGDRT